MKLCGQREVEPVVLAVGDALQSARASPGVASPRAELRHPAPPGHARLASASLGLALASAATLAQLVRVVMLRQWEEHHGGRLARLQRPAC
jgi:hypothetical protein